MPELPELIRLSWQRPGLDASQRSTAMAMLSPAELSRAELSRAGGDSIIQGRMLLRTLAGELLGLDPRAVPLSATCADCGGPHGQPRIPGLSVSLSHCATAVVAVATAEGHVGVDVEPLEGSTERAAAIAEVAGVGGIRRWTSVEAVLKCDGRGLRVDPREVAVTESSAALGDGRYQLWHPELAGDLQVTVAWRASSPA